MVKKQKQTKKHLKEYLNISSLSFKHRYWQVPRTVKWYMMKNNEILRSSPPESWLSVTKLLIRIFPKGKALVSIMKFSFISPKINFRRKKANPIILERLNPTWYDLLMQIKAFHPIQLLTLCSVRGSSIYVCSNTDWKSCHLMSCTSC